MKTAAVLAVLFFSLGALAQEKSAADGKPPNDSHKTQPTPFPDVLDPCSADIPPPCIKKPPKAINSPHAEYTDEARKQGIEGTVPLRMIVTGDGSVMNPTVIDHPPLGHGLEEQALAAVRQWRFEPARDQNDKPAAAFVSVKMRFSLHNPYASAQPVPNFRPDTRIPPRVLESVDPHYSEKAQKKGIEGTVILSLVVNEDGRATDITVVRPVGYGLDEKAVEAVSQWRFSPATRNGIPVSAQINVQVNFRLYH